MAIRTNTEFQVPMTAIDEASPTIEKTGRVAERSAKQVEKFGMAVISMNQALELARKFGRLLTTTLDQFASFETALVGVGKTSDLAGEALATLGRNIQDLSLKIPVSAVELAGIGQVAGQLGVKGSRDIEKFTTTIAKLSRATDLTGEEGASSLKKILDLTNTGVGQIDRLGSVIVRLGNNFAATESQIAKMSLDVARGLTVFGATYDQVAGLSTAMTALGIQAQLGGSAVGRTFREIDNAVRGGGAALDSLTRIVGMSGDEFKKVFQEDSVKAFTIFIDGLKRMQDQGKSVSLALDGMNLSGDEINKTIPVLATRVDLLKDALAQAADEAIRNTALTKESAAAFDTLAADMTLALNAAKNLAIEVGGALAPAFRDLAKEIKGSLEGLANFVRSARKIGIVNTVKQVKQFDDNREALAKLTKESNAYAEAVFFLQKAEEAGRKVDQNAYLKTLLNNFGSLEKATQVLGMSRDELEAHVADLGRQIGALSDQSSGVVDNLLGTAKAAAEAGNAIEEGAKKPRIMADELGDLKSRVEQAENALKAASKAANEFLKDSMKMGVEDKSDLVRFDAAGKLAEIAKVEEELRKVGRLAANAEAIKIARDDVIVGLQLQLKEIKKQEAEAALKAINDVMRQQAQDLIDEFENSVKDLDDVGSTTARISKSILSGISDALEGGAIRGMFNAIGIETSGLSEKFVDKASVEIGKAVSRIAKIFEAAVSVVQGTLGGGYINKVGDLVESLGQMPEMFLKAFERLDQLLTKFVDQLPKVMERLLQKVPQMMTRIADMIPKFIDALAAAIPKIAQVMADTGPIIMRKFMENLPKLITALGQAFTKIISSLGEIFDAIFDNLPEIIASIFDQIPEAFAEFFKQVPKIWESLMENLPDIVYEFVLGFIDAVGMIVEAFVDEFIFGGGLERIVGSFLRMIPRLYGAIIRAIIKGIANAFERIFKGQKTPGWVEKIGDGLEDGGKRLKKIIGNDSSKLFNVSDMADNMKEATAESMGKLEDLIIQADKAGKSIWQAFVDALVEGWHWLLEAGGKLWEGFKNAVGNAVAWLKEKGGQIWQGFKDAVGNAVAWLKEKGGMLWTGFTEAIGDAVAWFKEKGGNIWNGFTSAVKDLTAWFKERGGNIWSGFTESVKDIGAWFKEKGGMIWSGFANGVADIAAWFKEKGGMIWNGLTNGVKDIAGYFKSLGSSIWSGLYNGITNFDWGSLFGAITGGGGGGGGGGAISGTGTPLDRFHTGGMIRAARFADGGNVKAIPMIDLRAQGSDRVPVMTEVGETIINRQASQKNQALLSTINSGGSPGIGAGSLTIQNLNIYPQTATSASDIKDKIVPAVKEAIRKSSQDGQYIVSVNGLRSGVRG